MGIRNALRLCMFILGASVFFTITPAQGQHSLKPDFSYDKSEHIETYFFPPEKARWDGYEVLTSDWKSLDEQQKYKFVSEALQEIEDKEGVRVLFSGSKTELIDPLNKLAYFFGPGGQGGPIITILLKSLYMTGNIEGEIITFGPNHPFLSKQIFTGMNKENPEAEIGRTYVGYISCYKKGDEWLPDSEGPVIGEIKKRIFYDKRIMVPNGATLLTGNYPLNFEYKIIAFRWINSFVDDYGLGNYYYKVIFEPVRKVW